MNGDNQEVSEVPAPSSPLARPSRGRRVKLACLRCQRRKIKCDGELPKCTPCQKIGVDCVDGKKVSQDGAISRSDAASLHNHIQRLETIIRSNCPNVELPQVEDISNTDNGDTTSWPYASEETSRQPSVLVGPSVAARDAHQSSRLAHEIGLIPLSTGTDPKYIGPSSGFSFTKVLLARANRGRQLPRSLPSSSNEGLLTSELLKSSFKAKPSSLPETLEQALQLSRIYFDYIQHEYPFLHEPTFHRALSIIYDEPNKVDIMDKFQVWMVLAISASILSQRIRISFSGEGFCAAAMAIIDQIDIQSSLRGVQCLLLLIVFTLNSSFLSMNPWHLSYQCLASVLDLGLQRDVPSGPSMTLFEREMRTRVFWVIYSLDRRLATILGRPIGLRDEACDLRLPADIEDTDLSSSEILAARDLSTSPKYMASSIALFKLAQMNSEIKYILHSVSHTTPRYTYPYIADLDQWQNDFWERLQEQGRSITPLEGEYRYISIICQLRYNEIVMLLFRPTPRIKNPRSACLRHCHDSAEKTIHLWNSLYELNRLCYGWMTIHALCLAVVTMLYCIWTVPDIAAETQLDTLFNTMRISSNLLSAAGEHWPEARRSRQSLEDLVTATIRWLIDTRSKPSGNPRTKRQSHTERRAQHKARRQSNMSPSTGRNIIADVDSPPLTITGDQRGMQTAALPEFTPESFDIPGIDTYINAENLATFVGAPSVFANDLTMTMDGMFSDFQPTFDFDMLLDCFGDRGTNFAF